MDLPYPDIELGQKQNFADLHWTERSPLLREAEADLAALYPTLGEGGTRVVYDGGSVVYKIGCYDSNMQELHNYQEGELPVAPCRMVYHANGAPILIMETVMPIRSEDALPDWANRVDGAQVGRRVSGEIVCFDAGLSFCDESWLDKEISPYTVEFMQRHPTPRLFREAA